MTAPCTYKNLYYFCLILQSSPKMHLALLSNTHGNIVFSSGMQNYDHFVILTKPFKKFVR